MANNLYYLFLDIILVLLQLTVIICNGFIIFLFTRQKNLLQNSSRLLAALLTITDFLHAVTTLPYTLYLIISWNPVHFSLSSYCVMIFSIPVVIQLKINLTLTISIAVERTLAMYFPVVFRNLSSHSYAIFSLLFGFLLATLDLVLEFSLTPFNDSPNCTSVGCFLSDNFRYYWGISNMVMGIVVIVLMTSILIKLRTLQQKPGPLRAVKLRSNRFKQVLVSFEMGNF